MLMLMHDELIKYNFYSISYHFSFTRWRESKRVREGQKERETEKENVIYTWILMFHIYGSCGVYIYTCVYVW